MKVINRNKMTAHTRGLKIETLPTDLFYIGYNPFVTGSHFIITLTSRRSFPTMGSEKPQVITASRFLTITAEKGSDNEVL